MIFKKGAFKRQDEYLKTILKTYKLLIHTSKQISYVNGKNNF